jgi:tripartite ATP-independent transporter DctP family solute receptor
MISQLRSGALDFLTTTGPLMENFVPTASAPSLGFIFKGYPDVWTAMDGGIGTNLRKAFEKANLHAFEKIWDNGLRQITSSVKPIATPDDLRGMKIRVPVSPVAVSLFRALGAAPLSVPIKEAYSALQTRLADGQENPLVLIETWKFYEVNKYCSLSNHMWDGFWMLASGKTWSKLPANIQEIISRNWNSAALKQREDSEKLSLSLQKTLEGHGVQFNEVNRPAFQEALRKGGFYKEWQAKLGPELWSEVEKYAGNLT